MSRELLHIREYIKIKFFSYFIYEYRKLTHLEVAIGFINNSLVHLVHDTQYFPLACIDA